MSQRNSGPGSSSFLAGVGNERHPGTLYSRRGPDASRDHRRRFWLFDSPCTQALWTALGLENPSHFFDLRRPVERVSWQDMTGRFLPTLNDCIPGFTLPTEVQWEYAYRAGTQTAPCTGPIEILGDANVPALDAIAWYGGNSGVGFELDNGDEPSWLREQHYPGGQAGSHPIKGNQPNSWGLYDMLGNCWAWMDDVWHGSSEGAPGDGSARQSLGDSPRPIL